MTWSSWSEFWQMGGYAWFVWGSYGVCALLLLIEVLQLRAGARATLHKLLRWRRATACRREGTS